MDVSIFFTFSARGRGKGVRGDREGGAFFFFENPRRRGGGESPRRGGGERAESVCGEFGGGGSGLKVRRAKSAAKTPKIT